MSTAIIVPVLCWSETRFLTLREEQGVFENKVLTKIMD
jgi:hypothetical protein